MIHFKKEKKPYAQKKNKKFKKTKKKYKKPTKKTQKKSVFLTFGDIPHRSTACN